MDILSDKIVTTRKKHICSACGREFPAGTRMHTIVHTYDGIQVWRECPTCRILLSKYDEEFIDASEGVFYEGCVADYLKKDQTPEELLSILEAE